MKLQWYVVFDKRFAKPRENPNYFWCKERGMNAIMEVKAENETHARYLATKAYPGEISDFVAYTGRFIRKSGRVISVHFGPVTVWELLYYTEVVTVGKRAFCNARIDQLVKAGTHKRSKFTFNPAA